MDHLITHWTRGIVAICCLLFAIFQIPVALRVAPASAVTSSVVGFGFLVIALALALHNDLSHRN